jgi:predicted porin
MATISAWYAPHNNGTPAAGDSAFVGNDDGTFFGTAESAYELGITGSLGVKGLSTHAFMNKADKSDAAASKKDVKGTNIGASYNVGAVTVGYNYKKTEYTVDKDTTVSGETTQDEFGIAYALSPNLTLAANYTKADPNGTTMVDAKMKSLAVGYNLGAIALSAQAAKLENYTGISGADADVLYLRASTKF